MLTENEIEQIKKVLSAIIHSEERDGKWYSNLNVSKTILVQATFDKSLQHNVVRIRIEQPSDFKKIFKKFLSTNVIPTQNSPIEYITENIAYGFNYDDDEYTTTGTVRSDDFKKDIPLKVKKMMSEQTGSKECFFDYDCLIIKTEDALNETISVINQVYLQRGGDKKNSIVLREHKKPVYVPPSSNNIAPIVGFAANLITVKKESTADKLLLFIEKPNSETSFSKEIIQENIKKAISQEKLNPYQLLCNSIKKPQEGFSIIITGEALVGVYKAIKNQPKEESLKRDSTKTEVKPKTSIRATQVKASMYSKNKKPEETQPLIEQNKDNGCCLMQ